MRAIASQVYAEKRMTTVWWNPVTEQYFKPNNPHAEEPQYDVPITKPYEWTDARKGLTGASSSTDVDHYTFQPFTDEFLPMAVNFNEAMKKAQVGAGTLTTADYPLMTDTMVDTTMYDIVVRDFVLLDAVTRRAHDKLVFTFDDRTPYRNTFGLGENDVSPPRSISYATGTINLKKAQGHVSISRWLDLAIRRRNIREDNESIIDADFERGFTADMLTTLGGFTDDAVAGAYDVVAGGAFHMTNNPRADFYTDWTTIRNAGGKANVLVMNTETWLTLQSNSWMRTGGTSVVSQGPALEQPGTRTVTHPMLPGFTIYIEETLAKGVILNYDRRAALFLDGPRSMRVVEDNAHNIVDTYSDRWYGSGLRVSTWGIEMTGSVT